MISITEIVLGIGSDIVRLRDTSAHDMSLEHTVERLEERVERTEVKAAPPSTRPATLPQPEETQRGGLQ